jgi:hypothetical protein
VTITLSDLIAEIISGGHVSSFSSIPVTTNARASPFLAESVKHRGA